MKHRPLLLALTFTILAVATTTTNAKADGSHRLSFSAGVIRHGDPGSTDFLLGGEYEYRFFPTLGAGLLGQYIFSTPSETLIGFPVFLHPLAGDWVVYGAPLLSFKSDGNHVGARLGTRAPLPFGVLTLTPELAVDFIGGYRNYLFGLALGF
ncbi:MAG: hypothetical protein HY075_05630 [Deltaproteobacteria bacterium]|nr:hypothetical protein [Deltaproteobacteria bacterium]